MTDNICLDCKTDLWAEGLDDSIRLCHPCYIKRHTKIAEVGNDDR